MMSYTVNMCCCKAKRQRFWAVVVHMHMLHTGTCCSQTAEWYFHTQTQKTSAAQFDEGWDDLLPVRLHTVPVLWVYKDVDPISRHAFNETQTETHFWLENKGRESKVVTEVTWLKRALNSKHQLFTKDKLQTGPVEASCAQTQPNGLNNVGKLHVFAF